MARQARLAVPGQAHYLVQQAVHGQPMATDDEDRRTLWQALIDASRALQLPVWAAAVGHDELHLLLTPAQPDALGRFMQSVGRRYVAAFNRRHGRRGALWASRFATAVIEEGEPLLRCMLFIDRSNGPDAAWTSAAHHLGTRRDPLLHDAPELWTLGNTPFEREGRYARMLAQAPDAAFAERVRDAARRGGAVGSHAYISELASTLGRPLTPRRRGRPPRQSTDGAGTA